MNRPISVLTNTAEATGCIFCEIVRGTQPALFIEQTQNLVVVLSLEGSPLVVPRDHVPDVYALDDGLAREILPLAGRVARAMKAGLGCDGVTLTQANGAAAGQDVFHFHLHVIPRWVNDGKGFRWGDAAAPEGRRAEWAEKIRAQLI